MTVDDCVSFFKRFGYRLHSKRGDDTGVWLLLLDRRGEIEGFWYPKNAPPDRVAEYAREFITSRGFDLPDQS